MKSQKFPSDYPSCDYTGRLQRDKHVACDCYVDTDAVLNLKFHKVQADPRVNPSPTLPKKAGFSG